MGGAWWSHGGHMGACGSYMGVTWGSHDTWGSTAQGQQHTTETFLYKSWAELHPW